MDILQRLAISFSIGIFSWLIIYSIIKHNSKFEENKKDNFNKRENTNSIEKDEIIEIECQLCGIKFTISVNNNYSVFCCHRCRTIYESEVINSIRKIKMVKKGKIVPKEFENELKILGLKEELLDQEKLNSAWKKKLELYHPDKVSHLAQDFKLLAEEKTKELNEAYSKLKMWIIENKY